MAGDGTDLPATPQPEIIKAVKSNQKRNSLGPTGSPRSTKGNVAQNYLRASTGSCHDFCKFGREHSSERKPRIPLHRKVVSKPPDDQILVRSAVLPDRKIKLPATRPKSSPSSEIHKRDDTANVGKQKSLKPDRKSPLSNGSVSGDKKKEISVLKSTTALSSPRKLIRKNVPITNETSKKVPPQPKERRLSGSSVLPVKSISVAARRLSSSNSSSLLNPKRSNASFKAGNSKTSVGFKKNVAVPLSAASSSKQSMVKRPAAKNVLPRMTVERQMSGTTLSPKKKNTEGNKSNADAGDEISMDGVVEKTFFVVNGETLEKPLELEPSSSSTAGFSGQDENDDVPETDIFPEMPISPDTLSSFSSLPIQSLEEEDQMEYENGPETGVCSEISISTVTSLSQQKSPALYLQEVDQVENENGPETSILSDIPISTAMTSSLLTSSVTSLQDQDPMENENCPEEVMSPQILVSTAMSTSELDPPVLSLQEEDQMESECTLSESEEYSDSDFDETLSMQEEILEGVQQAQAARTRSIHPEDTDSKPVKLRFRRGKIVDMPESDHAPRRLNFRRVRTLDENQNVYASGRRKTSKRREAEGTGEEGDDGSTKVVLRHNDLQQKKDAQGSLLNNVIEETASKLVETRKSKVKALVGAFETVISLHDAKPSANAGS